VVRATGNLSIFANQTTARASGYDAPPMILQSMWPTARWTGPARGD